MSWALETGVGVERLDFSSDLEGALTVISDGRGDVQSATITEADWDLILETFGAVLDTRIQSSTRHTGCDVTLGYVESVSSSSGDVIDFVLIQGCTDPVAERLRGAVRELRAKYFGSAPPN